MSGFWGYEDATGLKAIGFVENTATCLNKFKPLGFATWDTVLAAEYNSVPVAPADLQDEINKLLAQKAAIAAGILPDHDHDDDVEGGLVAITVITWVGVLAVIIVLVYQYM